MSRTAARKSAQPAPVRSERADHIFAALMDGRSYADIARAEGLGVRRVQQIIRDTLKARETAPAEAWRELRIGHLQNALGLVTSELAKGKIAAVPQLIRLLRELQPLFEHAIHRLPANYGAEYCLVEFEALQNRISASRQAAAGLPAPVDGASADFAKPNAPQAVDIAQNGEIPRNSAAMESST